MASKELAPQYIETKQPKQVDGRLVVKHAPEVTWSWAENNWERLNRRMKRIGVERDNFQVAIKPHAGDVSLEFYRLIQNQQLGRYQAADLQEQRYPDQEIEAMIFGETNKAESVYVVGSIYDGEDVLRVIEMADQYKNTLGVKMVTLVAPFMAYGRGDKNVDKRGKYDGKMMRLRATMAAMSGSIDRMIVLEPHSSATQAYGAEFGIAVVPLSPWEYLLRAANERLLDMEQGIETVIGPEAGRNIAANRIAGKLGVPLVSFKQKRINGTEKEIANLTKMDQELVRGRLCLTFDDEAETVNTINNVAKKLDEYGAYGLVAILVHLKFAGKKWRENMGHPMIRKIFGTDSRQPVGNIRMKSGIEVVSLAPLIGDLIRADIAGVNFWKNPKYREMILQCQPEEGGC